jgi:hypothetical protein
VRLSRREQRNQRRAFAVAEQVQLGAIPAL